MADAWAKLRIGGEAKVVSMSMWQMRAIWQKLKYREGQ